MILRLPDLEYLGSPWTERGKESNENDCLDTSMWHDSDFLPLERRGHLSGREHRSTASRFAPTPSSESQHTPPSICWVTKKHCTWSVVTPAVAASQASNIQPALWELHFDGCNFANELKNSSVLFSSWISDKATLTVNSLSIYNSCEPAPVKSKLPCVCSMPPKRSCFEQRHFLLQQESISSYYIQQQMIAENINVQSITLAENVAAVEIINLETNRLCTKCSHSAGLHSLTL